MVEALSEAKYAKYTNTKHMGLGRGLEFKHKIGMTKPWDGNGSSPECGSFLFTPPNPHNCHLIKVLI